VALVEREKLGGTCLNRGLHPTKTMIASAAVAQQVRRAHEFGVRIPGPPTVDLAAVVDRKDGIVDTLRAGAHRTVERASDLDFYPTQGRFVGSRQFRVDGTDIDTERIFLVVGTRTAIPPIDGLDTVPYLTSRTLLDLRELPQHLVVIGGGYVGCEFAQMFRRFGSRVSVVQRAPRLLLAEDPEISAPVHCGRIGPCSRSGSPLRSPPQAGAGRSFPFRSTSTRSGAPSRSTTSLALSTASESGPSSKPAALSAGSPSDRPVCATATPSRSATPSPSRSSQRVPNVTTWLADIAAALDANPAQARSSTPWPSSTARRTCAGSTPPNAAPTCGRNGSPKWSGSLTRESKQRPKR
jgi:hypothetical protein